MKSGYALELQINSNKKRILAEYGWVGGKELLKAEEITGPQTQFSAIGAVCTFGKEKLQNIQIR